jgi:NADH-quinone oxidoreductase subunit C
MSTDIGGRLAEVLGLPASAVTVSGGGAFARSTVDVPVGSWVAAVTAARDALRCDFFDWLGAVDLGGAGYQVVAHVWSTVDRCGVLLRTHAPADAAAVPSVVAVYPGAAWCEREAHEMFGVDFPGHPDLAPLLLAPEFEGYPLRKDFVLASRVVKPWPGAVEPGESAADTAADRAPARGRRAQRPPGVPAPGEWGPR